MKEEDFVEKISVLHMGPGDILAVKVPGILTSEAYARIVDDVQSKLGKEHKVVILEDGADIAVVRKEQDSIKTVPLVLNHDYAIMPIGSVTFDKRLAEMVCKDDFIVMDPAYIVRKSRVEDGKTILEEIDIIEISVMGRSAQ